ncbi:MAG: thiazole synthase [Rickettsiales bacterium]|nr:thiazole synthase [Rickettsiales bacterium]
MGTSLFPNHSVLEKALEISETNLVTVSIRRIDLKSEVNIFNLLKKRYDFLPNTAGCFSSQEAILTAELGRESLETNFLKLELISDDETLLPDSIELLKTAKELIKKKFKIFAYCCDDPVICKKLEDIGCVAVMPLISPIGSGLGIRNEHNLELIREFCKGVVIVDAGIGRPSDATRIMELGFDGVLLNSSVARAMDPINMANAMKLAVKSGRIGFLSGVIEKNKYAIRSTENKGKISNF